LKPCRRRFTLIRVGVVESPGTPATQSNATSWFGPSFLLEESKLRPPSSRPGTVRRTALLDRLFASFDLPVVSIVAPPGYGKSALLSQWAEETPRRVAWVSIEAEDDDPAVLLAYIGAALERVQQIDIDVFRTRAPPGMSVAATVARRIAATMSGMVDPVSLVLDHTELLHNHQCRDAIAELAVHVPSTGQLVVASRGVPPVPLASLRARGAVLEVGVDELAMDEMEARLLLEGAGVELADTEVADLVGHTEGWPVGLYLAALALKAGSRRPTAGFAFSGDDRLMADYLRTELLSRVPRGRVSFLTRTSVLERMCGPLCDAVVDGTRSGRLLEELEGSNLLLVPLDRRREWYRYHKLFQQLLRTELGQRESGVVAQLHSRAAGWCESNGLSEMAITHAQAAGDTDQVARLVTACTQPAYASGRLGTVDRWFQWFDDHGLIGRYPSVAVLGAVLRAVMGQPAAADRWAAVAERASVEATLPDGSTMASWQAQLRAFLCRKGVAEMRRDAEMARDGLAPGSQWRSSALAMEGVSWLLDGEPERADPVLAQAVEVGLDTGAAPAVAVALAERAVVAIERGDWGDAESVAARALAVVRDGHLDDYGPGAIVHALVARTAAHRGDVSRAGESLGHAARLRPQLTYAVPFLAVQTLVELARAYLAVADAAGVRVVLREAGDILRLRPDLGRLPRQADELRSALDTLRVGSVGASSLTTAELRLVPLLSTHLSFREIGERLHVSRHTVKTQAISVYRKLGVSSRSEAIDRVREIGLLG
jgi:LuxR family transcriptional regulator, maltose regulon positive regulatory protein